MKTFWTLVGLVAICILAARREIKLEEEGGCTEGKCKKCGACEFGGIVEGEDGHE